MWSAAWCLATRFPVAFSTINVSPIAAIKLWLLAILELGRQMLLCFYHVLWMRGLKNTRRWQIAMKLPIDSNIRYFLLINARLYRFFKCQQILIVRCIPNFLSGRFLSLLAWEFAKPRDLLFWPLLGMNVIDIWSASWCIPLFPHAQIVGLWPVNVDPYGRLAQL